MSWRAPYADGDTLRYVDGDGQHVYFRSLDPIVSVELPAAYLSAAACAGIACVGGQSLRRINTVELVTDRGRALQLLDAATSPDSVVVEAHPDGRSFNVFADYGGQMCKRWQVSLDLVVIPFSDGKSYEELPGPPFPFVGSSQGLLWIEDHRIPHWMDVDRLVVVDGVTFGRSMRAGPWRVGQDQDGRFGGDCLVYNDTTRQLYSAGPMGNAQVRPLIASTPDRARCLITIQSTPARLVTTSQLVPLEISDPPAPEIRIPTFAKTTQKIGVGIFDEPDAPERMVWVTIDKDAKAFIQARADESKAKGLPFLAYYDGPGYTPAMVPSGLGVPVRPFVQCYPIEGESSAGTRARYAGTLDPFTAAGLEVDLLVAAYCQVDGLGVYHLTEQQVIDSLETAWHLKDTHRVGAIWLYLWEKRREVRDDAGHLIRTLHDGITRWAGIAECVKRMRAASADSRVFPTVPVETPKPNPSPTPQPNPGPEAIDDALLQGEPMPNQEYDADGLVSPTGKLYDFTPNLSVGHGSPDLFGTADGPSDTTKVIIVTIGGGHAFVRLPALSERYGRSVIGSFPDRTGAMTLRFEDDGVNADETAMFVRGRDGFDMEPPFMLWAAHSRRNANDQKIEFASTSVAVLNPRPRA